MTKTSAPVLPVLYNPDLLDDDALEAGFVARHDLLDFFISELRGVESKGTVQHHLIIGARGMGKTTLLRRLALAIRRDDELSARLIPLSFPEEQYNVKDLADLWLNALDALGDEFERIGDKDWARRLDNEISRIESEESGRDAIARRAKSMLIDQCLELGRRPVLFVDNIDIVFTRIDKSGRKVKGSDSGAYWDLREALSRSDSPVLIGGSVNLSEHLVTYEKAFYDFFATHILEKLEFKEMCEVLESLAERHSIERIKRIIRSEKPRLRTIYDLSGGNARTVIILFNLLAQGVESDVREDLERLLDNVTPLYKARFEELAEQTQIVFHALAMKWNPCTAADVAESVGLATNLVSAQLNNLVRDGLAAQVKLSGTKRVGFQVAERFFNIWLLMRTSRRMRQKLAYLTKFLESFYDIEERVDLAGRLLAGSHAGMERRRAELALAVAETLKEDEICKSLRAYAGTLLLDHCASNGKLLSEILGDGDLPDHQLTLLECREKIRSRAEDIRKAGYDPDELEYDIIGSIILKLKAKQLFANSIDKLIEAGRIVELMNAASEEKALLSSFFDNKIDKLKAIRAAVLDGYINPEFLKVNDIKGAIKHYDIPELSNVIVNLLLLDSQIEFFDDHELMLFIDFIASEISESRIQASSQLEWGRLGIKFRRSKKFEIAEKIMRKAIELYPFDSSSWCSLGVLLQDHLGRHEEAEPFFRKAIELDPTTPFYWVSLGRWLRNFDRYEESEQVLRKAIELDPNDSFSWSSLGNLLQDQPGRYEEAEPFFREAIELDPSDSFYWASLGRLLRSLGRYEEAEQVFRKAIELDPNDSFYCWLLGSFFQDYLGKYEEAEMAYRKAIELDPTDVDIWNWLGELLQNKLGKYRDAEDAYLNALKIDSGFLTAQMELAILALRFGETRKAIDIIDGRIGGGISDPYALNIIKILLELRRDNWGAASGFFKELFIGFDSIIPSKSLDHVILILAFAIECGMGEKMLILLDELGCRDTNWPLVAGFEAALSGNEDILLNTAPEARDAAVKIYEMLREKRKELLIAE